MLRRKALIAAVGASLALGAAAFAPAAHAGGHVGFNLSFAGPGYGVTVGNAPYYYGPRYVAPYVAPTYYAPAYVAPAYTYYDYAPPVVYSAPVVVSAPYRYGYYRPYGRVYYHRHH